MDNYRKPWWRRWFGTRSERAAEKFLRRQGFKILARNYRCSFGELDLVAADGNCLVFVEVRSTGEEDTSRPSASVDFVKQKRLSELALHYLQKHRLLENPARFDVLSISWPADASKPTIEHHRSAFDVIGRFQMFT